MRRHFLLLSAVLFLLLAGCVYKTEWNLSNKLSLTFHEPIDADFDGSPDSSYIIYSPAKIEGNDFTISIGRTIYTYPVEYTVEPRRDILDADTISFINANLAKLKQDIEKEDASCRARVSFSICNDEDSCEAACFTDECEEKNLGPLLLDYRKLVDERDELLRTASFLASSLKEGDSLSELSTSLTRLQTVLSSMSNHPLVRDVGFCAFSADVGSLISSTGFITPVKQKALVVTYVDGEPQDGSAVELNLKEVVDPSITSNVESFSLPEDVDRESKRPTVLKFSPFKLTDVPRTFYYTYSATGALRPDNTPFALWKGLTADIRIVALQLGGVEAYFKVVDDIYQQILQFVAFPAFSSGIALGVVWLMLVLVYEFALYLFRLAMLLRMKRPLPYSLRRAFGYASMSWNVDAIIAIVLFALSFGLEAYVLQPVSIPSLNLENISVAVQAEPLSGAVIFLSFVASFFFVSFFVDRLKRLLAGRAYDEEREVPTPEKNLLLWRQLRDAVENAKQELEDVSKGEMDVSSQLSQLLAIPVEKLREEIYSNPDQYKVRASLKEALEKVSDILESIHHKSELARENREKWVSYIRKKMAKAERLPLDALVSIPIEWRYWAVKEYLKEHPEDFVELEGTMLVKLKATPQQRAASYIEKVSEGMDKKLSAICVVEGQKILSVRSNLSSPSYVNNLMVMLSSRLDEVSASSSLAKFEKSIAYTKSFNSKRVIVIVDAALFEEVSERLEKFSAML